MRERHRGGEDPVVRARVEVRACVEVLKGATVEICTDGLLNVV